MKILLTGASGFTGYHFTHLALQRGHDVIPLERNLCDGIGLLASPAPPDFTHVVHLAAISFTAHTDFPALYDVNLFGTLNLLDALMAWGRTPDKILLASSANVYGNATISPIDETVAPAPVNHYATSKLAMECMAKTYLDRLPIIISRPFNYVGPGQAQEFVIPKLVRHFHTRATVIELGNLDVEREFNDVRMVCEAYLALLEQGTTGEIYNICSGQPHSLKEIIGYLSRLTGHALDVHVNPAFVRANEIKRLCGEPKKLYAAIGKVFSPTIEDSLEWILKSAESGAFRESGLPAYQ